VPDPLAPPPLPRVRCPMASCAVAPVNGMAESMVQRCAASRRWQAMDGFGL